MIARRSAGYTKGLSIVERLSLLRPARQQLLRTLRRMPARAIECAHSHQSGKSYISTMGMQKSSNISILNARQLLSTTLRCTRNVWQSPSRDFASGFSRRAHDSNIIGDAHVEDALVVLSRVAYCKCKSLDLLQSGRISAAARDSSDSRSGHEYLHNRWESQHLFSIRQVVAKHEVLGQGAAPSLAYEEGIDRVSDLVGDSASVLLQNMNRRLQRDGRGGSAATVRDLCRIGTHPPTSASGKQTKDRARAQPKESMGASQRSDSVLQASHAAVCLEVALEDAMERHRTRRDGRVARWGPAYRSRATSTGEHLAEAKEISDAMFDSAYVGVLGHLPAVVLGDRAAAELDSLLGAIEEKRGVVDDDDGLADVLQQALRAVARAMGATAMASGTGSYRLVQVLKRIIVAAFDRGVQLPLESLATTCVSLCAMSHARPIAFLLAAIVQSLERATYGADTVSGTTRRTSQSARPGAIPELLSIPKGTSVEDWALLHASCGRALIEMAVSFSGSLSENVAEVRLERRDQQPTKPIDVKPVTADYPEKFPRSYKLPPYIYNVRHDPNTRAPMSVEWSLRAATELLKRASTLAESTRRPPSPGGPFIRELTLGLEMLHAVHGGGRHSPLKTEFGWLARPDVRAGADESASYRNRLHSHPLAYPVAWAANQSTTYCSGPYSDCCQGCVPSGKTAYGEPSAASTQGSDDVASGRDVNPGPELSHPPRALARAVSTTFTSTAWGTQPSTWTRLDSLVWEGEDVEGHWDGFLTEQDQELYIDMARSGKLPFPGPLVVGRATGLQVGIDPRTGAALDVRTSMPPPVRADLMWHGLQVGVLLSGSCRRGVALLRLYQDEASDAELESELLRGFSCPSSADDPMSHLLSVDRLAREQLDAGGTLAVYARDGTVIPGDSDGASSYGFEYLSLASYKRTVRSRALQAIAARRGIALLIAKVQDQTMGMDLDQGFHVKLEVGRRQGYRYALQFLSAGKPDHPYRRGQGSDGPAASSGDSHGIGGQDWESSDIVNAREPSTDHGLSERTRRADDATALAATSFERKTAQMSQAYIPAAVGLREAVSAIMLEPRIALTVPRTIAHLKTDVA